VRALRRAVRRRGLAHGDACPGPADYADVRHQQVAAALLTVVPVGQRTDVVAVMAALRAAGKAELLDYVAVLIDVAPTSDPLPNWIAAVAEASLARRTATAMETGARAIVAGEPRERVEHALEQQLAAIRASAPDGRVFDDKALMAAAALAYLDDDGRSGTPYGFAPLDAVVLPVLSSHLVLIGGASGRASRWSPGTSCARWSSGPAGAWAG
jgi:replicative DNA helicase